MNATPVFVKNTECGMGTHWGAFRLGLLSDDVLALPHHLEIPGQGPRVRVIVDSRADSHRAVGDFPVLDYSADHQA